MSAVIPELAEEILHRIDGSRDGVSMLYLDRNVSSGPEGIRDEIDVLEGYLIREVHNVWVLTEEGREWIEENETGDIHRTYECSDCRSGPEFEINSDEVGPPEQCPWCGGHTIEAVESRYISSGGEP